MIGWNPDEFDRKFWAGEPLHEIVVELVPEHFTPEEGFSYDDERSARAAY